MPSIKPPRETPQKNKKASIPHISDIVLSQEQDEFYWNLHPFGQFSVKSHYLATIHADVPNLNIHLWKLKALLKVKIFLCYLRRGMVLTKDNLIKRDWKCDKKCCSVAFAPGTRRFNIFFCCHFARAVWSITNAASGLLQPHSISHMFGNWLQGISKEMKPLVLLGAATTCWSFWLCRNDLVFERKINPSSLHVIFSVIHWLRSWIILQNSGFFLPGHMGGGLPTDWQSLASQFITFLSFPF